MSFVFEEGQKGASAKHVKEEEGGEPVVEEDEGERELGKVKSYNEEKGFAFIVSGESLERYEMVRLNLGFQGSLHGRRRSFCAQAGVWQY